MGDLASYVGILGRLLCRIGRHKPRVVSGDGRSAFAIRERRGYYERLAAAAGRSRVAVVDRAQ